MPWNTFDVPIKPGRQRALLALRTSAEESRHVA